MTPTFAQLVAGEGPPPKRIEGLTRTDFVQWVGALADFMSPIHYDDSAAREAGYEAPISPGMLQAGMLSEYATEWLGAENMRRFAVRFRGVVLPGEPLVFSGRVVRKHEGEMGCQVDVELECRRAEGDDVVVSGEATFVVDREGEDGASEG